MGKRVQPRVMHQSIHSEILFSSSGVIIDTDGNRHFGGVVESSEYCDSFMTRRVESWARDLVSLADMASTMPQAAYTVFTKGYSSKWLYHLRCSPCSPALLAPVDIAIDTSLIPSLLGVSVPSGSTERELLPLPARHGGLALPVLAKLASSEYTTSAAITEPLVQLLMTGSYEAGTVGSWLLISEAAEGDSLVHSPVLESVSVLPPSGSPPPLPSAHVNAVTSAVRAVRTAARASKAAKNVAAVERRDEIWMNLSPEQRFLLEIAGEKGVSSWLTAYPCYQDGSVMRKSDFRDALCIAYIRVHTINDSMMYESVLAQEAYANTKKLS